VADELEEEDEAAVEEAEEEEAEEEEAAGMDMPTSRWCNAVTMPVEGLVGFVTSTSTLTLTLTSSPNLSHNIVFA